MNLVHTNQKFSVSSDGYHARLLFQIGQLREMMPHCFVGCLYGLQLFLNSSVADSEERRRQREQPQGHRQLDQEHCRTTPDSTGANRSLREVCLFCGFLRVASCEDDDDDDGDDDHAYKAPWSRHSRYRGTIGLQFCDDQSRCTNARVIIQLSVGLLLFSNRFLAKLYSHRLKMYYIRAVVLLFSQYIYWCCSLFVLIYIAVIRSNNKLFDRCSLPILCFSQN